LRRLHEKPAEEAFAHHRDNVPERVYEHDPTQSVRIAKSRALVALALQFLRGTEQVLKPKRIIELGCGTADISGYFSWGHRVKGYEACPTHFPKTALRWPHMIVPEGKDEPDRGLIQANIETLEPEACDILILCETLEHLGDPVGVCGKWLPLAKYAVISSPCRGDFVGEGRNAQQADASGGEHVWSFDPQDFKDFLRAGAHQVLKHEEFLMGACYNIWLTLSRLENKEPQAENVEAKPVCTQPQVT
jgi:hypothetical protein